MKKLSGIMVLLFAFGFAAFVNSDPISVFAGPISDYSIAQLKCPDVCSTQGMTWAGAWKKQDINHAFCICNK